MIQRKYPNKGSSVLGDFGRTSLGDSIYGLVWGRDTSILDNIVNLNPTDVRDDLFNAMRRYAPYEVEVKTDDGMIKKTVGTLDGITLIHTLYREDEHGVPVSYDIMDNKYQDDALDQEDDLYFTNGDDDEPVKGKRAKKTDDGVKRRYRQYIYSDESELLAMCTVKTVIYRTTYDTATGLPEIELVYQLQCDDRAAALAIASQSTYGSSYYVHSAASRLVLLPAQEGTIDFPFVDELAALLLDGKMTGSHIQLEAHTKKSRKALRAAREKGSKAKTTSELNQDIGLDVPWWRDGSLSKEIKIRLPVSKTSNGVRVVNHEEITVHDFSLDRILETGTNVRYGIPVHKLLQLQESYRLILLMMNLFNDKTPFTGYDVYCRQINSGRSEQLDNQTFNNPLSDSTVNLILTSLLRRMIINPSIRKIVDLMTRSMHKDGTLIAQPRNERDLMEYVKAHLMVYGEVGKALGLFKEEGQTQKGFIDSITDRIKDDDALMAVMGVEIRDTIAGGVQ